MPQTEIVSFVNGGNPLKDSLALFILQTLIIIAVSRLIGYGLKYINQPRVIAEVLGGILLGNSALCKIPAFKNNVFPDSSLPGLQLVANIGLVLFLFLVGLELDLSTMFGNAKKAAVISLAGIIVPFIVSIGASRALYDLLMTDADKVHSPYSSFLIFTGVAMSITAFPVLARILSERNMMHSDVGQITISSAAVDDAVAWALLLVIVAIVNNTGQYVSAVYVFLAVAAWALFLVFAIRPLFKKMIAASQYSDNVSQFAVFITFMLTFVSAWFTEAAGVHAIFGAFLAGLIIPHDHGFAIKVTEKIEDLVSILFLPLYFAYSGLNTRIDQLDNGVAWGMIFLVIGVACVGKILGVFVAAKVLGIGNRESLAVGVLMNTKGLVELIVLNLGYNAGVINVNVFTVMVVMALATTFMTVPLISVVYPPSMYAHKKLLSDKDGMGAHGAAAGSVTGSSSSQHLALPKRLGMEDVADGQEGPVKILLALPNMSSVRPMMSLMQMITSAVEVTALRLMPLGDRLGALLKVKESGETLRADPVLGMFKTFAQLNHIAIDSMIAIAPEHDFAEHIVNCAEENEINMIVLSHRPATVSDDAEHHDHQLSLPSLGSSAAQLAMERRSVIDKVCKTASCSVAVMLDRGFNVGENDVQVPANLLTVRSMNSLKVRSPVSGQASIYLPFVGGVDDREALLFALQFHKGVNMHIIILKVEEETAVKVTMLSEKQESSTETIQVEAVAEENRDNKLPQQHRSLTTDSVEADTDLLEILKEKVDANAAKSISSSSDGPSDVLSMATVSVPYGSEYASMMDWIRQRGLGRGDMVVIGRALYEKGKDASSLIQQKNHNAHFASQTVLERETGCSLCIVQHHSS